MNAAADLLDVYRASHYQVRMPGGRRVTLRIGQPAPLALINWADPDWPLACISACNPQSEKLSATHNRQRMRELLGRVRSYQGRVLAAAGRIPGHEWRESSLLVAALTLDRIDTLALDFDQNAVVVIRPGLRIRLRIYRREWASLSDPTSDLEAPDDSVINTSQRANQRERSAGKSPNG
ncbi:MAG TPA: DUF3293 domain-containing protein [Dokdonella sp.]|uniref:DUF3293 domain-containing protein n=1 Tax=Dokdonella sp. TaxID=2291710 RepID=UPI002D7F401F|nr:DUF3293 domain-containing protein [Dokdonella sp.]HET9034093.1 DUF3293 domain-containing protein [Dokdonella sp.]